MQDDKSLLRAAVRFIQEVSDPHRRNQICRLRCFNSSLWRPLQKSFTTEAWTTQATSGYSWHVLLSFLFSLFRNLTDTIPHHFQAAMNASGVPVHPQSLFVIYFLALSPSFLFFLFSVCLLFHAWWGHHAKSPPPPLVVGIVDLLTNFPIHGISLRLLRCTLKPSCYHISVPSTYFLQHFFSLTHLHRECSPPHCIPYSEPGLLAERSLRWESEWEDVEGGAELGLESEREKMLRGPIFISLVFLISFVPFSTYT